MSKDELIKQAKETIKTQNFSLISQNCIGAVIYHDMGMKFLSPTVNLYFDSKDFIKFVENLDYYLSCDITFLKDVGYIIANIDDLKLYCLHYHEFDEVKEKWNDRKVRVLKDRIFIISTDRDGFDDTDFKKFKNLKYPKALITCKEKWKDADFVIYLDKYKNDSQVPDTIPDREFYKDNKIIELINQAMRNQTINIFL